MKIRSIQLLYIAQLVALVSFSTFASCSKKNNPAPSQKTTVNGSSSTLPSVIVDSISNVTSTTAIVYGSINSSVQISDRGALWGLTQNPTGNKTSATTYSSGSNDITVNITGLSPGTTYYIRIYGVNKNGTAYSNDKQFTTLSPPNHIKIITDTLFASGAYTAFAAGYVTDSLGIGVKESGICIATTTNPKITDRKVVSPGKNDLNVFVRIDSLKEATSYNIRAYCVDKFGKVSYGGNVGISTIARGKVTYKMVNEDPNADASTKAAYQEISTAMDKAVEYQNDFTSCVKAESVNYSPGTPTADGNISGWINVGASRDYHDIGTMLHEIQHTLGGGTSWYWPRLIVNGVYVGKNATQMLRFMTRNPNALLYGDSQHSWPYGFNGYWEDTGNPMDYIIHCLILQGMKKDGLPDDQ